MANVFSVSLCTVRFPNTFTSIIKLPSNLRDIEISNIDSRVEKNTVGS